MPGTPAVGPNAPEAIQHGVIGLVGLTVVLTAGEELKRGRRLVTTKRMVPGLNRSGVNPMMATATSGPWQTLFATPDQSPPPRNLAPEVVKAVAPNLRAATHATA